MRALRFAARAFAGLLAVGIAVVPAAVALPDGETRAVTAAGGTLIDQIYVVDEGGSITDNLYLLASALGVNAVFDASDVSDQVKLVAVDAPAGLTVTLEGATFQGLQVKLLLKLSADFQARQGVQALTLTFENARTGVRVSVRVLVNIR